MCCIASITKPAESLNGALTGQASSAGRLDQNRLISLRCGTTGMLPPILINRQSTIRNCMILLISLKTRSEEHTSELQSLMRISYAVFCLQQKKIHNTYKLHTTI